MCCKSLREASATFQDVEFTPFKIGDVVYYGGELHVK